MQRPERRMYLAWKAARADSDWYRSGCGPSPLMQVARKFKVPVRVVRDAIETQRGPGRRTSYPRATSTRRRE